MNNIFNLPLRLLMLLLLVGAALGQEVTGDIEGTVKDPNASVVPGVVITVNSAGTSTGARPDSTAGFTRTITSDSNGFYRMRQIPPGSYTVTTTATAGFGEATKTNVQALVKTGGNQRRAASLLKIKATTLNAKIRQLGIQMLRES